MNRLAMAALVLGLVGFVGSVRAEEKKGADPVGTWEWAAGRPGAGGADAPKATLKITKDGDKLAGALTMPGRNGAAGRETKIEDLKYDSKTGEVTFSVSRDRNGTKVTTNYKGTLKGDAIEGKSIGKNQNGEDQERDWKATKAKADKSDKNDK